MNRKGRQNLFKDWHYNSRDHLEISKVVDEYGLKVFPKVNYEGVNIVDGLNIGISPVDKTSSFVHIDSRNSICVSLSRSEDVWKLDVLDMVFGQYYNICQYYEDNPNLRQIALFLRFSAALDKVQQDGIIEGYKLWDYI